MSNAVDVIEARKAAIGDGAEVHGYPGSPLAAPPLPPVPLRPR